MRARWAALLLGAAMGLAWESRAELALAQEPSQAEDTKVTAAAPSADPGNGSPNEEQAYPVTVGGETAFVVRLPLRRRSAEERARDASHALDAASRAGGAVTITRRGTQRGVQLGSRPIILLRAEDAEAEGYGDIDDYAKSVVLGIEQALDPTLARKKVAEQVYYAALAVTLGLIAVWATRRVRARLGRSRAWFEERRDRGRALNLLGFEVLSPAALHSVSLLTVSLVHRLIAPAFFGAWLMVALSLFAATRSYPEKITAIVTEPISEFLTRLLALLPPFALTVGVVVICWLLLRFVGLFFASVESGERALEWLPRERLAAAGSLAKGAIVVVALVFVAPLVTGTLDGTFGRLSLMTTVVVGVAVVPILASALVGLRTVFFNGPRLDQFVTVGPHRGQVVGLDVLEIRIKTLEGAIVRIPQLALLVQPWLEGSLFSRFRLELAPATEEGAPPAETAFAALEAELGLDVTVSLESWEPSRARYLLCVGPLKHPSELLALPGLLRQRLEAQNLKIGKLEALPQQTALG